MITFCFNVGIGSLNIMIRKRVFQIELKIVPLAERIKICSVNSNLIKTTLSFPNRETYIRMIYIKQA